MIIISTLIVMFMLMLYFFNVVDSILENEEYWRNKCNESTLIYLKHLKEQINKSLKELKSIDANEYSEENQEKLNQINKNLDYYIKKVYELNDQIIKAQNKNNADGYQEFFMYLNDAIDSTNKCR